MGKSSFFLNIKKNLVKKNITERKRLVPQLLIYISVVEERGKGKKDVEESLEKSYLSNALRFRILKNDNRTNKGWIDIWFL